MSCRGTDKGLKEVNEQGRKRGSELDLSSFFEDLATGNIALIAGAPHQVGVPAKEAHVGWPVGVVRRPDGDLIVTDFFANRLWRIDREGILHAFVGDGVPGASGDGGPAA